MSNIQKSTARVARKLGLRGEKRLVQLELELTRLVERVDEARPRSLRRFDQISMNPGDLLDQGIDIMERTTGQELALLGDHDGISMVIGQLTSLGVPGPGHMTILDFDLGVLDQWNRLARAGRFADVTDFWPYNVFDPIPRMLHKRHDWFYTNPPFGRYNHGESVKLFTTRGIELCDPIRSRGAVALPIGSSRPWTQTGFQNLSRMLSRAGWIIDELRKDAHRYRLDDDPDLRSSLLVVSGRQTSFSALEYAGRCVKHGEIPRFYGRNVMPPFPRYVGWNGERIWVA